MADKESMEEYVKAVKVEALINFESIDITEYGANRIIRQMKYLEQELDPLEPTVVDLHIIKSQL